MSGSATPRSRSSSRDRPRTHRPPLKYPAAAAYVGMSVNFLRRVKAEGEIPFIKLGKSVLFDPDELDAWIDKNRRRG